MKINKILLKLSLPAVLLFFIGSCTKFSEPPLISDPNQTYTGSPVVTSVEPSDSAVAGVREITLIGKNFAVNGKDTNWVYIGNKTASIKSISSDKLVVYRPVTYGNSLEIKVVVPSALSIAKISNYNIEEPVIEFSDFSYQNYSLTAFAVDKQENIYVGTHRKILKLSPNGIDLVEYASLSSTYLNFTDMKMGPGGYIYILVGRRAVYRLEMSTGKDEQYVSLPENSNKMDFDADGNIYTAGRNGIYVVHTDKTVSASGKHDGVAIDEIRVFNGYLYSSDGSILWRNQITDNKGNLGDDQTVIDLSGIPDLSNCSIKSFNMDIKGTLFICLANHPKYSVFVLEQDGSVTPYYNENILPLSVDQIIFGNGRFMYLSRGSLSRDSVRFYRMGMENNGAPYYGRE